MHLDLGLLKTRQFLDKGLLGMSVLWISKPELSHTGAYTELSAEEKPAGSLHISLWAEMAPVARR